MIRMVISGFDYPTILMLSLGGWWQNIELSCLKYWDGLCGHGRTSIIEMAYVLTIGLRIFSLFLLASTKARFDVLIAIRRLLSVEIAARRMAQMVMPL